LQQSAGIPHSIEDESIDKIWTQPSIHWYLATLWRLA